MKKNIFASIRFLFLSVIIFGGFYTLSITGIGQLFFSHQANGSQIILDNQIVGSEFIGQSFEQLKYFSGRSEKVSQLSPVSVKQKNLVETRACAELEKNPSEEKVPIDLVTASASGVDPDISVDAAEFQVDRIAKVRGIAPEKIRQIINKYQKKDWFSHRSYVNVLQLNIALDKLEL